MSDVTAALITAKETVTFRAFTQVPPPPGCVTINISLCGICGTDIHSFRSGHLHSPAVCGHEWVGTVAAAGTGVDGLSDGDRVVLAVPPACARCPECRRGLGEYCRTASLVARGRDSFAPPHGGFAGTITVQAARVLHAHPDLTDEVAAQVEPATVAFHGVRRSGITAGDMVVVQGAGPIGLLALQFARAAGAGEVLVVEPSPTRRWLATELGATSALTPDEAAEYVLDHTQGIGADVVTRTPTTTSAAA
jgi:(R,R)-butanediol dehydrogenase / meso-butanediol dehydrogenase / diacetyl reductase